MRAASPLIIEGPDGAGKTKLALDLADHFEMEYMRPPAELLDSTTGPGEGLVEWWDEQLARPLDELAMTVYDRCFYISDPIYQLAVPTRSLFVNPDALSRGIMRLWNAEPFIIFCLPEYAVCMSNMHASGRSVLQGVDGQSWLKIYNMYWATYALWAQALYDNVLKYNYEEDEAWPRLLDHFAAVA